VAHGGVLGCEAEVLLNRAGGGRHGVGLLVAANEIEDLFLAIGKHAVQLNSYDPFGKNDLAGPVQPVEARH
jgi:hypothetical protein